MPTPDYKYGRTMIDGLYTYCLLHKADTLTVACPDETIAKTALDRLVDTCPCPGPDTSMERIVLWRDGSNVCGRIVFKAAVERA